MSATLTTAVRQALRRIPVLLEEDGFADDTGLCAELHLEYADIRTAIAILYRQRRIDRCEHYLVPIPHPGPPAPPSRPAE